MAVAGISLLLAATLLLSAPSIASAQALTVETDADSYETGDTITISGNVGTTVQAGQPVLIRVTDPMGVLVRVDQVQAAADGSYTYSYPAGGLMRNSGEHTVQVTYRNTDQTTTFDFTATGTEPSAWRVYTLEIAGESYPIRYQITGGSVQSMTADPELQTLMVAISSTADGMLTIELPRTVMDAEGDEFAVFVDGDFGNFAVDELEPTDQARTLTIEFEQGAGEIEIVGTYMVPEFGAIAAIVLAVAIVGIIVATARYGKFSSFAGKNW
jgi:predicted secreted protein with PEFG-CTERM motif